jgi:hypothetical protein
MLRIFAILLLFISTSWIAGCGKGDHEEALMYGKWATITGINDTLYFYQKNGKDIMSYNISFNSPIQKTENEFRLSNGKLSIRYSTSTGVTDWFEYDSFRWLTERKKFELHGNQRFPFLSSIQPMYIYQKIQ